MHRFRGYPIIDVLRGDEATLKKLTGKKVIIGGTALELGDRFSVPNGAVLSGPVLQALAAELILQNRTLRWTSDAVALIGLCIIALVMMWPWRRLSASLRVVAAGGDRGRRRDVGGSASIANIRDPRHRAVSISRSPSTSPPSRSTKSTFAICSAASPKAASSASRCRWATASSAPTRIV